MAFFGYIIEFNNNQEGYLRTLDHINVHRALKYTWACSSGIAILFSTYSRSCIMYVVGLSSYSSTAYAYALRHGYSVNLAL